MTLYEMLERVKEAHPEKHRTRIVLDLNRRIADFCRAAKLLTTAEDLFTQALVDSNGNMLVTESGEELVSAEYGAEFRLPWNCYSLTDLEDPSGDYSYTLKVGVLRFFYDKTRVTFDAATGVTITLHFNKKPALLEDDADTPEFHEDFHEGPLYYLLAEYAALKADKLADYWHAQGEIKQREARIYATTLGRQSYDVKPIRWSS